MKKLLITGLIVSAAFAAKSQNDSISNKKLNVDFRISDVGANVSVGYEQKLHKISFFAGLMYHINREVTDNRQYAYRHRFYHRSFIDGFGINAGLTYPVKITKSDLGLHLLFVSQVNHMNRRGLLPVYDSTFNYIYNEYYYFENNKLTIIENCFGLGSSIKAYGNLYLNMSIAIGIANFFGVNPYDKGDGKIRRTEWEFSHHYKIGLSYLLPSG